MTEADRLRMRARVKQAEGFQGQLYKDSEGYFTIGYGRLLDPIRGGRVSQDEAEYMLSNDLRVAERLCEAMPAYLDLSPVRQAVLIEMCFNLGAAGLKHFKRMFSALVKQEYDYAASEMLNSRWAMQVKGRAVRLAKQMELGEWQ